MTNFFKLLPTVLARSFHLLRRSDPLILAASTAFFATFSLGPILVILINVLSAVFRNENISRKLFDRIRSVFGPESARQIETIAHNFNSFHNEWWVTLGVFLFLIFVATTLLRVVKNAIHQLWHIGKKPSAGFFHSAMERFTSFGMILIIGLLFMSTLLIDAGTAVLRTYLLETVPSMDTVLIRLLHTIFSILAISTWFTLLFRILPDARASLKVVIAGGLITGMLFNLGEFVLRKLLVYGNVYTLFGASTSFVIVLLFIFYSSMIVYFGASFTHEYGEATGRPVRPRDHAIRYEKKNIDG